MADELELKEIPANPADKTWLPLGLRKIMTNEYVDHMITYQKMYDPQIRGRIYGQHSLRRISPLINFERLEHLINTEDKNG